MRPYLGTALNVAPVRDVPPTVRPSVPRLRFSLNFKFGGNITLDKSRPNSKFESVALLVVHRDQQLEGCGFEA